MNRLVAAIAASLALGAAATGCHPSSNAVPPPVNRPAGNSTANSVASSTDQSDLAALNADLAGIDAATQAATEDVGAADQAAAENDNP